MKKYFFSDAVLASFLFLFSVTVVFGQDDGTEMGEIVVTANRVSNDIASLPTNVTVVKKEEIVQNNAKTAADAIENALGITEVSQRGFYGAGRDIRIRSGGDTSNQVLVMVDGQPVNDVSMGSAYLEQIPADCIDRIEIIRGPNSALWGANALGGVVNIITKVPEKGAIASDSLVSVGSYGTQNYKINAMAEQDGKRLFFIGNKDNSIGWRENSHYYGSDFVLKLGKDLSEKQKVDFRLLYHQSLFGIPGKNTTPIPDYDGSTERIAQFPDSHMEKQKEDFQLEYESKPGADTTINIKAYGNTGETVYNAPSEATNDISSVSTFGTEIQFNMPGSFVLGANIHEDSFKRTDILIYPYVTDIDKNIINISAFVQKTLIYKKLTAVIGARYDHHSVFGPQTDPRLSFIYRISEKLKFSANAGRAFRAPTFEDLYSPYTSWPAYGKGLPGDSMGNTALLPEKAWGGDIGFESDYKNKLINRITLFGSIISDMIAWDEVDPDENYDKWRPSNIGNAYNLGIEAEIIHKISKYFTQKIDYTYLDSKGKTDISSTYKTLMYTPEHRINYRFNYKSCRGLGLTFTVSSTDRIRWEDGYGLIHILPRYTLLNAVINKEIKGFNVFLSINNILAEKYQSREDYPLPGRNSSGGIKIVF